MVDKAVITQIHAKFRQLRSGEVTDNLKAQGVSYRLAWGVQSYRMREIAAGFEKDTEVAEYLWNEDVRESKLLAPRLFPIEAMTPEIAERWADNIPYTEIADQVVMHLFSQLPFALPLAEEWIGKDESDMKVYMSLMIASRMEHPSALLLEKARFIADGNKPMWVKTAAIRVIENQ